MKKENEYDTKRNIFEYFSGITADSTLFPEICVLCRNVLKHFEILRNQAQKSTNVWLIKFQGNHEIEIKFHIAIPLTSERTTVGSK